MNPHTHISDSHLNAHNAIIQNTIYTLKMGSKGTSRLISIESKEQLKAKVSDYQTEGHFQLVRRNSGEPI